MPYYVYFLPFFFVSTAITFVLRRRWAGSKPSDGKKLIGKRHLEYGVFKLITQALVIMIGLVGILTNRSNHTLSAWLIFAGLCVSFLGDASLYNMRSNRAFITGLFIFLIAVSLYAVSLTIRTGFTMLDLVPGGIMFVVYVGLLVYFLRGIDPAYILPIVLYGLVWCYLIARAFSLFYAAPFSIVHALLITGGTIVFFSGDICLAIWKLKNPKISLSSETLTYAIGQACIAVSLSYFPA
jgi:uncharacterized membrane protein YhhN